MRRRPLIIPVLALVVAACGNGDTADTTTTSSTPPSDPTTTEAAPTTTAAPPTTTTLPDMAELREDVAAAINPAGWPDAQILEVVLPSVTFCAVTVDPRVDGDLSEDDGFLILGGRPTGEEYEREQVQVSVYATYPDDALDELIGGASTCGPIDLENPNQGTTITGTSSAEVTTVAGFEGARSLSPTVIVWDDDTPDLYQVTDIFVGVVEGYLVRALTITVALDGHAESRAADLLETLVSDLGDVLRR